MQVKEAGKGRPGNFRQIEEGNERNYDIIVSANASYEGDESIKLEYEIE